MSAGGGSWVSHFQIMLPAVSLTGHPCEHHPGATWDFLLSLLHCHHKAMALQQLLLAEDRKSN